MVDFPEVEELERRFIGECLSISSGGILMLDDRIYHNNKFKKRVLYFYNREYIINLIVF